ncbi:MAG: BON domain-containing protein [Epsilonproteobacteria bacterium]|nr:BON domain-containing protein [Campylobacterota bacterium]
MVAKGIGIALLTLHLMAQEPVDELQKALQAFLLLLEQSQRSLQELTQTDQEPIPEAKNSFLVYYRHIENKAPVEPRNDLLIKTQIEYKFIKTKGIPASTIMTIVRNGSVELYGKVHSKESARKAMDLALRVKGVREVTSYLIIKEPIKVRL